MPLLRRTVLGALGSLVPALGALAAEPERTRAVLLGTKGGPTPSADRATPGTLIMAGGQPYLIDCGNGVANQLAKAGVRLPRLSQIFITHNHSDHVIDVGTVIVLAWAAGLSTSITVHGPPPVAQFVRRSISASEYDIAARIREEGRTPLLPLVHVHEFSAAGPVFRDANVTVTCALVDHWTVKPAFAYRFDAKDRSIVISGDTTYSENLIALAQGADVLIHEAMYVAAIDQLSSTNPAALREHLVKSHTTTEQLGRIAARAGVKKLVLSHLVPAFPTITDEMWLRDIRKSFSGEVVVGRDLMEV